MSEGLLGHGILVDYVTFGLFAAGGLAFFLLSRTAGQEASEAPQERFWRVLDEREKAK